MRLATSDTGDYPARVGLEPDVILPVQFFSQLQRRTAWTAELRLMAALLEDALIVCSRPVGSPTSKSARLLRETLRWVRSDNRTWVFSFLRVCESLDLDPGAIREAVRLRCAGLFTFHGDPGAPTEVAPH